MISVVEVLGDKKLEALFCQYAVSASLADVHRHPKFYQTEQNLLAKNNNIHFNYCARNFWLALRGGKVLGRVAATIDSRVSGQGQTKKIGFIGFYEAINEAAVADALLDAAIRFISAEGCDQIWGPIDYSIYQGYRFQTNLFDSEPFLGEPRNPSYYVDHFLRRGFKVLQTWESHSLNSDSVDLLVKQYQPDYDRSLTLGYRYNCFSDFRRRDVVTLVWSLIQETYKNMPGFIELTLLDFTRQFSSILTIVDWNSSAFVSDSEGVVGFSIIMKDKMAAIRAMKGESSLWAKVKFLLADHQSNTAIASHVGIKRKAIKNALLQGLKRDGYPLSLAKSLFHFCAIQLEKNGFRDRVIISLLRSDTPNIHLSREYAAETRCYSLFSLEI